MVSIDEDFSALGVSGFDEGIEFGEDLTGCEVDQAHDDEVGVGFEAVGDVEPAEEGDGAF